MRVLRSNRNGRGQEVARIMDGLLVELTRVPGIHLRLNLGIEGTAEDGGHPKEVEGQRYDLRLDQDNIGLEEK